MLVNKLSFYEYRGPELSIYRTVRVLHHESRKFQGYRAA
jgi:hypothetical protein